MACTVLIVDDSLTVRMDLADTFMSAGFQPLLSGTAAEARNALRHEAVDAVILDVLLPDGDGVQLLEDIRTAPRVAGLPVVMLSSEAEIKDRIRGLKTGADDYVGKPYDAAYLVAKVEELVRSRRQSDARSVLVIDDSATFRDALRIQVEAAGYTAVTASTGEEGLRIASARRPDAIVVDGVLPGMDGATMIRHVRLDAALRDVPCLLLTGSEEKHAELRALDAGADSFARKDEDLDVVLARLAAMLRASPACQQRAERATSLGGLKKILAVDDSLTYLHGVADVLKEEGYDVILARSGEEALELLAVQPVDCILLDVLMPGLSGRETCERIKAAPAVRQIPVIMLTGLEGREAMIDGLSAGADDYLSKTSDTDVLKARVRAQIRRKQLEDENNRVREELLASALEATEARSARQIAEARALLVDELERKNKELEAFSYSVSHDLRAPLRAIDGFSRIVLEGSGEALDSKGREYLQRVCAAATRMGELIDDMLELSRVGRAEIRYERVNLSVLAEQVVADLRQRSDRQVTVIIEPGLLVSGDNKLMRIVLENLLGNCWKFTANRSDARIRVGREQPPRGDDIYFVRDNGAGFDMTYVDKLFRPFQRLHSEVDFPGSGIGLATVQRIVDRHGGRVSAAGAVGRGATIYFSLPTIPPVGAA